MAVTTGKGHVFRIRSNIKFLSYILPLQSENRHCTNFRNAAMLTAPGVG